MAVNQILHSLDTHHHQFSLIFISIMKEEIRASEEREMLPSSNYVEYLHHSRQIVHSRADIFGAFRMLAAEFFKCRMLGDFVMYYFD